MHSAQCFVLFCFVLLVSFLCVCLVLSCFCLWFFETNLVLLSKQIFSKVTFNVAECWFLWSQMEFDHI